MKEIKEKKFLLFWQKILLDLYELHKQRIIHRDIKPGNIMIVDDYSPKIVDLGLAKILGSINSNMNTILNTPLLIWNINNNKWRKYLISKC